MTDIEPDDWAFHFDTGRPCLNFTATLAERGGRSYDRWRDAGDLVRWFAEAGNEAPAHVSANDLDAARDLREAIYRLVTAANAGRKPKSVDVDMVNHWAAKPVAAPQLSADARHLVWRTGRAFEAALADLARDAIELVTSHDLTKLRECEEHSCSVLFVDHSRPGKRRWCSMSRCGNRMKKAAFRKRQAEA
jgi:predicted RNA-binding Zn ribbon-like protein